MKLLLTLVMSSGLLSANALSPDFNQLQQVEKTTSVDKPVCVKDSFSSKPITCPPGMHVEIRTFTTTTTECSGGFSIGRWISVRGWCRT